METSNPRGVAWGILSIYYLLVVYKTADIQGFTWGILILYCLLVAVTIYVAAQLSNKGR